MRLLLIHHHHDLLFGMFWVGMFWVCADKVDIESVKSSPSPDPRSKKKEQRTHTHSLTTPQPLGEAETDTLHHAPSEGEAWIGRKATTRKKAEASGGGVSHT